MCQSDELRLIAAVLLTGAVARPVFTPDHCVGLQRTERGNTGGDGVHFDWSWIHN